VAEPTLYIARPADVEALRGHWDAVQSDKKGRTVVLQAATGGGKRAVVGQLVRDLQGSDTDFLIWRTALVEEEDGLRTLLRLYGSLFAALHRDTMLRSKVELILNSQLPKVDKRVQGWFQAFTQALRTGAPKPGEEKFQVSMPRDNPLLALVELVGGIARRMPVLVEVQNVHASQSVAIHGMLEALGQELLHDGQALLVLGMELPSDENKAWMPAPLVEALERRADTMHLHVVAPWGEQETTDFLSSKSLEANAAELARIASGRPGFIADLAEWLDAEGRLGEINAEVTLSSLVPLAVDEAELDDADTAEAEPAAEGAPPKRRKAGAADVGDVAFRAALLGRAFPSGVLADIWGYERDSIDDLLDAADGLFAELQFSKPLGTWVYQFTHAIFREGVLEGRDGDDDKKQAANTAGFLHRFLAPRGYEFLVKTARLYARAGNVQNAQVLKSMALTADQPQVWAMTHELLTYFDDVAWPDAMHRTVYMNLLDRLVQQGGDVNQSEGLFNKAMTWAQEKEDRPMQGWLLLAGSRLDLRRQDFYRARDRAKDALKLYQALNQPVQAADVLNHLARVELADGNPTAANEAAGQAIQVGQVDTPEGKRVLPQVAAQAEATRGRIAKRERKWEDAAKHFKTANEIAGRTNQAGLALDSGLNLGECLLLNGETGRAADILTRVVQIAQGLRNPVAHRQSAALLAQAHGSQRNFEAALKWAKVTLELTTQLKFDRLLPMDTYQVGFFELMLGRPTEALALFRKAQTGANLQQNVIFAKELLFHTGLAAMRIGEQDVARKAYTAALPACEAAKDLRKAMAAHEALASLSSDKDEARKHLESAISKAEAASLKEERKKLRQKLSDFR